MGRFLLGFEAVLSGKVPAPSAGLGVSMPRGLEELLAANVMSTYFDPDFAPAEFLPWLAQWVATSVREDWDVPTQRSFVKQAVSLYRMRGTRAGIERVLQLYFSDVWVLDGEDLVLDEGATAPAHYFQVRLVVAEKDPDLLVDTKRMVQAIVDQQKPAHTYYGLLLEYPTMEITDDEQTGIVLDDETLVLGTIASDGN